MLLSGNSWTAQICLARSPHHLCRAFSRRTVRPFLCQIPSLTGYLAGTRLFESSSGYPPPSCSNLLCYARYNIPGHSSQGKRCDFDSKSGGFCCTYGSTEPASRPDLERDSQTLDRIGDRQAHAGRLVFCRGTGYNRNREGAYVAYIQSTGFNPIDQVVPGESAMIGDPRENRETIHGDHISMVKFSTKDDPGF